MTKQNGQHTVIIIAGPTASGKSAYALERARSCNGAIINADSMQVYDALPTLTARPTPEEQQTTPHRLYGVLPPAESCTAVRWRDMAMREIMEVFRQGRTPLLVGGTGFYIKALTEGLSPIPEIPAPVREKGRMMLETFGAEGLHKALAERDPVMSERLEPGDSQRLLRAWEVLEATGKSLSYWQELPPEGPPAEWSFEYEVLLPDRSVLHDRINKRFDNMMLRGALEEVRALDRLIEKGDVPADALIIKAHGFRALRSYLHGECSLEEAAEKTRIETRQYAKRQVTWIRNQLPAEKRIVAL